MSPSKTTTASRWHYYWKQGLLLLALALLAVGCHLLLDSSNIHDCHHVDRQEKDEHTIPTLLSVVQDDGRGNYLYALDHPLYERLKHSDISMDTTGDHDVVERPTLHLSASNNNNNNNSTGNNSTIRIHPRGALTVSWTKGQRRDGSPVVQEEDVLLLYCGDRPYVHLRATRYPHQFLEAATISMARATSQKHDDRQTMNQQQGPQDENEWYFPSFPVVGHDACQFRLVRALSSKDSRKTYGSTLYDNTYVLSAVSEILQITDGASSPFAIHLALGDGIDTMVVHFQTGQSGTPTVRYGVRPEAMLLSASGTSQSYTASDMCQAPANRAEPGKFQPPGQLHVVTLTHLEPNTTYHYQTGLQDSSGRLTWSPTISHFVSAPKVQAEAEAFSYIVYGDQGCPAVGWGEGGAWTAAMTAREVDGTSNHLPIRMVHHFGDISYARGAAHIWDEWFHMISSFTPRVPLMISIGNHEYDHTGGGGKGKDPSGVIDPGGYRPKWGNYGVPSGGSGGECGVPVANHFQMPNSTNSNGVFWYSFDFANVHTTVISSEHDLSPGSRQYRWLEEDLKSVDRIRTPWLVLELHRPMYESEMDPINSVVGIQIRHRIETLLKQYRVDLVLGGHYHSYMRTCHGLYESKCNHGGPVHITVGTSGARLRHGHLYPRIHWTEKYVKGVFGYGRITVANASALHFEFVQAGDHRTGSDGGKVLDETWILKDEEVGRAPGAQYLEAYPVVGLM